MFMLVGYSFRNSGVFAGNKQILGGAFIGIYAGELLLEEVAEKRGKSVLFLLSNIFANGFTDMQDV
jgi:hypothetical protein